MMNRTIYAALLAGLSLVSGYSYADEPKPDEETTFNLGIASDYRYRGLSQSRLQPALQGGADYTNNKLGWYAGTWLSTIKWTKDAGGGGDIEWDIYGGKRGELTKDLGYDVGVLTYVYPSNGLNKVSGWADANTTEIYGQLSMGIFSAKYSHTLTNIFGTVNSKGSGYFDLSANVDLTEGYTLNLHAGRQNVKNFSAGSYTDWKIGVSKEFYSINFSLAAIGTNADEKVYFTPAGKFTGKKALVLTATKTF